MPELLRHVFGWVCGQNPAHTWSPGGELLPLCQRCTGVYVGAFAAALLHLAWRPAPAPRWLWLNGAFLLFIVPSGFYWIPQNPELRCASGILFGFGLVAFLWLTLPENPFRGSRDDEAQTETGSQKSKIENKSEPTHDAGAPSTVSASFKPEPVTSRDGARRSDRVMAAWPGITPWNSPHGGSYKLFVASLFATLALTPVLAENGNAAAAKILTAACVAGALALAALLLANLFFLLCWLFRRISTSTA